MWRSTSVKISLGGLGDVAQELFRRAFASRQNPENARKIGTKHVKGVLLHGPPGTGKTLLAISLANIFNASYYIIDGSPDLDRRDIEGNWELIKGATKFNYGPLTLAIKDANQYGIAFVIINEINAIRENEQISLNSLLSEYHINLISKGFEKHELNSKSKLIIIGTMNKGVAGINKLQEAFEDRFIISPEINYSLKNKEIEIAVQMSGCKKKFLMDNQWLKVVMVYMMQFRIFTMLEKNLKHLLFL